VIGSWLSWKIQHEIGSIEQSVLDGATTVNLRNRFLGTHEGGIFMVAYGKEQWRHGEPERPRLCT
jgi:hypothetical protein